MISAPTLIIGPDGGELSDRREFITFHHNAWGSPEAMQCAWIRGDPPCDIGAIVDTMAHHTKRRPFGFLEAEDLDLDLDDVEELVEAAGPHLFGVAFSYNSLGAFPRCVFIVQTLTVLKLSHTSIGALPDEIGLLVALMDLEASGNGLAVLPRTMANLKALHCLVLNDNALTEAPEWLGELPCLETLHLSQNMIASLPPRVGGGEMASLHLCDNRFSAFPRIDGLDRLDDLRLDGNRLEDVPAWVKALPELLTCSCAPRVQSQHAHLDHTCHLETPLRPAERWDWRPQEDPGDTLNRHIHRLRSGRLDHVWAMLQCEKCMHIWRESADVRLLATLFFDRKLFEGPRHLPQKQQVEIYTANVSETFRCLKEIGAIDLDYPVAQTVALVPHLFEAGSSAPMTHHLLSLHLYAVLALYIGDTRPAFPKSTFWLVRNAASTFPEDWSSAVKLLAAVYPNAASWICDNFTDRRFLPVGCYPHPHTLAFYLYAWIDRHATARSGLALAPHPLEYGDQNMIEKVGLEMYTHLFRDNAGVMALRDD